MWCLDCSVFSVYKCAFFWPLSDYTKVTAIGQPETRSQPEFCRIFIHTLGWSSRKQQQTDHFTSSVTEIYTKNILVGSRSFRPHSGKSKCNSGYTNSFDYESK